MTRTDFIQQCSRYLSYHLLILGGFAVLGIVLNSWQLWASGVAFWVAAVSNIWYRTLFGFEP